MNVRLISENTGVCFLCNKHSSYSWLKTIGWYLHSERCMVEYLGVNENVKRRIEEERRKWINKKKRTVSMWEDRSDGNITGGNVGDKPLKPPLWLREKWKRNDVATERQGEEECTCHLYTVGSMCVHGQRDEPQGKGKCLTQNILWWIKQKCVVTITDLWYNGFRKIPSEYRSRLLQYLYVSAVTYKIGYQSLESECRSGWGQM